MEKDKNPKSVSLYREKDDYNSRYIDFYIAKNGQLVMYKQDLGIGPKGSYGSSEYETWTMVEPGQKDALIVALMEKAFGGDSFAMDEFRNFLSEHGIKWDFYSC